MGINERLAAIQKYYQLNNSDFAEILQISGATLSHIYKGRNNPSLPIFEAIAKHYPDIDMNWLITGNKHMLIKENASKTNVNNKESQPNTYVNEKRIEEATVKKESVPPIAFHQEADPAYTLSNPTNKSKRSSLETDNPIVQIITVYASGEFVILSPKN